MSSAAFLAEVRASWGRTWDDFATNAHSAAKKVQDDWSAYAGKVEKVLTDMAETGAILSRLPGLIDRYEKAGGKFGAKYRENYNIMARQFNILTAGIFEAAESAPPAPVPQLGLAWFVVAGVTLSLLGVCFAIAAYEYCQHLTIQARAQEAEVNGRIKAMEEGKTLQPSTMPPPPPPGSNKDLYIIGGLSAVGLAALAWWAFKE